MAAETPNVKHVTMVCPAAKCDHEAFVQVLIVDDQDLQKKIDKRANDKLKIALENAHKEGQHD